MDIIEKVGMAIVWILLGVCIGMIITHLQDDYFRNRYNKTEEHTRCSEPFQWYDFNMNLKRNVEYCVEFDRATNKVTIRENCFSKE